MHAWGEVEQVMRATDGRGADHVHDPAGGDVNDLSLECISFRRDLQITGFASGKIPNCATNRVLRKNVSWVGPRWGASQLQDPAEVPATTAALFSLYERGHLPVQIGASSPLDRAVDAQQEISLRRVQGNVVLTA